MFNPNLIQNSIIITRQILVFGMEVPNFILPYV